MAKEREPRPLSIGSAVRFTHNGVTIHGHLVQRQGRRRFANVIDNQERTWKVPESALKDTGGGRRTTMVTPHDEARANYRLGDRVAFPGPDGPLPGEIVKLNPKRARVRCGEACWKRPLWPARCRRGASCEERRGAVELHRGDGQTVDG